MLDLNADTNVEGAGAYACLFASRHEAVEFHRELGVHHGSKWGIVPRRLRINGETHELWVVFEIKEKP
jgi:hypothetical protein